MKAVIPAAGLGTRFLPLTKNSPKEMLPLLGKPAIQYVVEEAVNAGCDDILIITGRGKTTIEDHFDKTPELEEILEERGKNEDLTQIEEIAELADIHYIRQKERLGLGHAIMKARKHVGEEPFAVLLGDDVVFGDSPCTKQLIDRYDETGASIVAVEEITPDQAPQYGVVDVEDNGHALREISDMVEKPAPEEAPSNLGILGRYVLTPRIFEALDKTEPGHGGEIQLTDALDILNEWEETYAYAFDGRRYDLGNKVDWLRTNIEVAYHDDRYREHIEPLMERLLDEDDHGRSG